MVVVTADHVLSPGTLHQYPVERNDTQWSPTEKTEGIKIRIRRRRMRRKRRRRRSRRRKRKRKKRRRRRRRRRKEKEQEEKNCIIRI